MDDFRPHGDFNRSKKRVDRLTHEQKKAAEAARWQGQIHSDYLNEQLGQASNGIKHPKKMGSGKTSGRPQFDDPARFDESKKPGFEKSGWKGTDDNYDDRT